MAGQTSSQPSSPIHVVYPGNGHATYETETFVMGQIRPKDTSTRLKIQGHFVPLTAHGFFSFPVTLHPGENSIVLECTHQGQLVQEKRQIISHKPVRVLPEKPLAIHMETVMPKEPIALRPGDHLTIVFSASVHAAIYLEIPGIVEMPALVSEMYPNISVGAAAYVDNREPIFQELHQTKHKIPKSGFYEVTIQIPIQARAIEQAPVIAVLHAKDGSQKRITLPTTVSVWEHPKRAVVKENASHPDGAVIRLEPPEGDRLTPLKPGAELWIDGCVGEWCRMRLSPQDTAWIHQSDISWQAEKSSSEPPYVLVSQLTTEPVISSKGDVQEVIRIKSDTLLPLHLETYANRVSLQLYGATASSTLAHQADDTSGNAIFQQVHWQQERENVLKCDALIKNARSRISGIDFEYAPTETTVKVTALPKKIEQIRILIDPGHGGSELGSTGLSGLPEKSLNLTVSKMLQEKLKQLGFAEVHSTRQDDKDVSLQARSALARKLRPHIVLSLHHNALPDGRDPRNYEGACCFYYHPFSKPLAKHLQSALVKHAKTPDYGVFYESFHLTRIPQAISVLVELGFFTNPQEFERLITPEFQQKAVDALAHGLVSFCLESPV